MDRPSRFLIVDDDEAERVIMSHTFTRAFQGANVTCVSNCIAAETLIDAERFDAISVDYNLADGNGLEFIEKIRLQHADLPMILVTSVGDELLAADALRRGASDYIPKSRINSDSISRTILRAIHNAAQSRMIKEQANELEHFAYALAHDFKQPIRQIRIFASLIGEEINVAEDESVRQHLHFLQEASRRLSELVDVMTQYTLLLQPPAIESVELNSIFSEVKLILAEFVAERKAELRFDESVQYVKGSPTLLRQIMENLVINGIKYNKSPVPRVEVTLKEASDKLILQVRDNGIGIEPQYLTEIFKPLTRLHSADEYPGTGLGLTMTRKAVLAQDGAIWCESTPGSGSTFYVQLQRGNTDTESAAAGF